VAVSKETVSSKSAMPENLIFTKKYKIYIKTKIQSVLKSDSLRLYATPRKIPQRIMGSIVIRANIKLPENSADIIKTNKTTKDKNV